MLKRSISLGAQPAPPSDPALPGGDRLVDPVWLCRLIRATASADHENESVRFDGVRYKPGARLTVVVVMGIERFTFRAYRRGEAEGVAHKLRAHGVGAEDLRVDLENEVVGLRFPHDHELPGLERLTATRAGAVYLRRLLPEFVDERRRLRAHTYVPKLLRYKPERHAVYHLSFIVRDAQTREKTEASLIARVYPPNAEPFMAPRSIGDVTPATRAVDRSEGVAVEEYLPGEPAELALDRADGTTCDEALRTIASSVERFHGGCSLSIAAPASSAMETDRLDTWFDPACSFARTIAPRTIEQLQLHLSRAEGLLAAGRASPVGVHGDLHIGQVLLHDTRAYLVDLEKARWGDASNDLGDLLFSWLHWRHSRDPESLKAEEVQRALTLLEEGYGKGHVFDRARASAYAVRAAARQAGALVRNLNRDADSRAANLVAIARLCGEAAEQRVPREKT